MSGSISRADKSWETLPKGLGVFIPNAGILYNNNYGEKPTVRWFAAQSESNHSWLGRRSGKLDPRQKWIARSTTRTKQGQLKCPTGRSLRMSIIGNRDSSAKQPESWYYRRHGQCPRSGNMERTCTNHLEREIRRTIQFLRIQTTFLIRAGLRDVCYTTMSHFNHAYI